MTTMNAKVTFTFSLLAVVMIACGDGGDELTGGLQRGGNGGPGEDGTNPGEDGKPAADDPALCTSKTYAGFDNRELTGERKVLKLGTDRSRMKPFSALQTEYARVLGNTPASLTGSAATFGQPPARWYEEPAANAVALQTAYSIAFDGCLTYTGTAAEFASAPDAASAETQCAAMARKFWSKTPGPSEISSCVEVATTGSAAEPNARRKWAYACASVLTSAGFLAY
jgi:hypothetical protein